MNATTKGTPRGMRTLGWVAVASMLAVALLAPSGAAAAPGNQTNVHWSEATQLCTGGPGGAITPVEGMVAWVFIHTGQDGPGTLTANFDAAGQQVTGSYVQGNLKYIIWTGFDTLLNFSDNLDGGVLTLSHVCAGQTTTTTTTDTTTTDTTTTDTTTTDTTTTQSTTTQSTTTSTSTSFSQSVGGITDPPVITNPPSDALGSETAMTPGSAWRLLLIGLAGLIASLLVLTPAKASRRR